MFARSQYRRRFCVLFSVPVIAAGVAGLGRQHYLIVTASDYADRRR